MDPRSVVCAGSLLVLYVVGWIVSGQPIQRGASALAFYVGFLGAILIGFFLSDMLPRKEKPESSTVTEQPPSDKAKMREAVLAGVLEAIKGLVVRSENAEKELKLLKDRMSELSLAAGLKPRVARVPETREG